MEKIKLWWRFEGRYYHKTFIRGIKNLWKWLPVVWKDKDWDPSHIYKILQFKLEQQAYIYDQITSGQTTYLSLGYQQENTLDIIISKYTELIKNTADATEKEKLKLKSDLGKDKKDLAKKEKNLEFREIAGTLWYVLKFHIEIQDIKIRVI